MFEGPGNFSGIGWDIVLGCGRLADCGIRGVLDGRTKAGLGWATGPSP